MFSVRSWSPPVMKHFVPAMEKVPSALLFAVAFKAPTSEPATGSVRHIVPAQVPSNIFLTKMAFSSSEQNFSTSRAAPDVKDGVREKA